MLNEILTEIVSQLATHTQICQGLLDITTNQQAKINELELKIKSLKEDYNHSQMSAALNARY